VDNLENEPKASRLKRSVLREEIRSYIVDAIMRGTYKRGDRLVETQIAKELGVSQAPVREAIRDLEQMGMLKTVPYKGAYVKGYSQQDVKNAYEVRAVLEGLAIRQAVQQMTETEINLLESIYNKMLSSLSTQDVQEQVALDVEFHELIIKASQNNVLMTAWRSISATYWTYFGMYTFDSETLVKRHQELIISFKNKNPEQAEQHIRNHFLELKEKLAD
jgi:DNA-binding GntR family transcriptional regulator